MKTKYTNLTISTYFFLALVLMIHSVNAATIKGVVTDFKTDEPLIGAVVLIKETKVASSVGLDGSYILKNVSVGTYILEVSYIGYTSQSISITVGSGGETIKSDFKLKETSKELNEVEVVGKVNNETETGSRMTEKNSNIVMNVISAKAIELLPDITVANVLQRMSGISLEKSSQGDGRYPIIRGMEPRYSYTMVNNIKIPSPDFRQRYVPLDLFPSELMEKIEVFKTLTPNLEGDGTGGVVNMVMKNAPDKLLIQANIATGYNQQFFNRPFDSYNTQSISLKSPYELKGGSYQVQPSDFNNQNFNIKSASPAPNGILSLTLGNRFLKGKLGMILSGTYQSKNQGAQSVFFDNDIKPTQQGPNNSNYVQLGSVSNRKYSTNQVRLAFNNKIDFAFNDNHKLGLYSTYIRMYDTQTRLRNDTSFKNYYNGTNLGVVTQDIRDRYQIQDIYNSTLNGKHQLFPFLKFDWTGAFSLASNQLPDFSEIGTTNDGNGTYLQEFKRNWYHNNERDLTGMLNITYSSVILETKVDWTIGGLYRDRYRTSFFDTYTLNPNSGINPNTGQPSPNQYVSGIMNAYAGSYYTSKNKPGQGTTDANNYTWQENVGAAYAMTKFDLWKKLQVVGGVRMEQTNQNYFCYNTDVTYPGRQGTFGYLDFLPSVNLKYAFHPKQNIRLSYYNSITRPAYYEKVRYNNANDNENYQTGGNPLLLHSYATNLDARYEFFPGANEQLLVGIFYKNIDNAIEWSIQPGASAGLNPTLVPINPSSSIKNFGIEIAFEKYFKSIGLSGNYTYTNSSVTTTKIYNLPVGNGGSFTSTYPTQTRPMQGQAAHIANLSVLLKLQSIGFEAQLALNYTGRKIAFVSPYYNLDWWQKEMVTLDFSAEKKLYKNFMLYIKLQNIVNTPLVYEIQQSFTSADYGGNVAHQTDGQNIVVQKDYYGQNYILGLRFKL